MSTEEEFQKAIELVSSCKASVSCGCEINDLQADWLALKCKDYLAAWRVRRAQV